MTFTGAGFESLWLVEGAEIVTFDGIVFRPCEVGVVSSDN